MILLICASRVVRITDVSHQCPAPSTFFGEGLGLPKVQTLPTGWTKGSHTRNGRLFSSWGQPYSKHQVL
jgi:hypothetical protein